MNDDKLVKIDISGSISDAFTKLAGNVLGGIVVLAIVGSLVAPVFAFMFEAHFQSESMNRGPKHNYSSLDSYGLAVKMRPIKIGLWAICIISWSILFWCNTPK